MSDALRRSRGGQSGSKARVPKGYDKLSGEEKHQKDVALVEAGLVKVIAVLPCVDDLP